MVRTMFSAISLGGLFFLNPATAQTLATTPAPTMYLQASTGDSHSKGLVVGATFPWQGASMALGTGALSIHFDGWVGSWRNQRRHVKRFDSTTLGFGPMLRWRGSEGASPLFMEIGVGVMYSHKTLYYNGKPMGSHWNFTPQAAVGSNFGSKNQHELSLRFFHASNAGIKKPNPGLDFIQLRYAHSF